MSPLLTTPEASASSATPAESAPSDRHLASTDPGAAVEPATSEVVTPIDQYLARQRQLTPVERFARAHDAGEEPAGARWWRDRIPVAAPEPGAQYGFVVDLDACTGCKACVTACHSLNGLEADEAWRRVGSLHGTGEHGPVVQTVTAACHHCVEPACLAGCPVDAYEKDPVTGIVSHLDDQCIGCSYCTLTCPYEVPQMRPDLGIVRKCDLCAGRLAAGEAPACVQGCPNGAIRVEVVAVADLRAEARASDASLVPGAPASALTVPSTRYVSRTPPPAGLVAASTHSVSPATAHPPLAVMLVLTQVAVGTLVLGMAAEWMGVSTTGWLPGVALVTGLVALGASVLHLGRPTLAWRAVLGVGHSWLSREIVAFGAFAVTAAAAAGSRLVDLGSMVTDVFDAAAVLTGVAGVACSARLYVVTGRTWWRARDTAVRFAVTASVSGASVVLLAAVAGLSAPLVPASVVMAAAVVGVAQLAWWRRTSTEPADLARTAWLLRHPLGGLVGWRIGLLVVGGLASPALVLALHAADARPAALVVGVLGLVVVAAAELIERHLFFAASSPPRMPGVL